MISLRSNVDQVVARLRAAVVRLPATVDAGLAEAAEGPVLDAVREATPVRSGELRDAWRAAGAGVVNDAEYAEVVLELGAVEESISVSDIERIVGNHVEHAIREAL